MLTYFVQRETYYGQRNFWIAKKNTPIILKIFELDLLKEGTPGILASFLKDRPIDIFINNAIVGSSSQHFEAVLSKRWLEC